MSVMLVENIRWLLWNSKILKLKRTPIILIFANLLFWIACTQFYFTERFHIFYRGGQTLLFNGTACEPEFSIILLMIWSCLTILGLLFFNVYCFCHWGTVKFKSKNVKKNWLAILLLSLGFSGGVASLSYYILVVEMKYGISQDSDTPQKKG